MPNDETRSTLAPEDPEEERRRAAREWKRLQLNPPEAPVPPGRYRPRFRSNDPGFIAEPVVSAEPEGEPWSDLPGPRGNDHGTKRS